MYAHASPRRWVMRFIAPALAAVVGMLTMFMSPASAHGSAVDPASRSYRCWQVWGSDFQNPAMQTEDPMCWQAWQANTNTMWNWMSLFRENMAGNFQAFIPDGQLCSDGQAQGGLANSLDKVGPWKTTNIGSNFSVHIHDQASHGADYIKVYVTKQGFNPETQALGWGNLELLTTTGRYAPATDYVVNSVTASGRTGHHIVYTIWQASHLDQTYLMCSDVNFG